MVGISYKGAGILCRSCQDDLEECLALPENKTGILWSQKPGVQAQTSPQIQRLQKEQKS